MVFSGSASLHESEGNTGTHETLQYECMHNSAQVGFVGTLKHWNI